MCVTLTLCVFSKKFFKSFFQNFLQYFFQKFLPKFFPNLRHTASTMVSLVPGLGSRKFAPQVVHLSLASLGLVAANSRLHASLTFYVRNPNLVRYLQNFFQKFFPKFFQYVFQKLLPKCFPKLRHTASTMVSLVPGLGSRKFATQVVYLSLAFLGLVAANSRPHASFTFYVRNPNLVRFFENFLQYFFQKFLPKFFPKLRHTASTMVSLVPGLGSRKFATQVVYLSLASLGLVAANSRLHASLTFYVRNPNLVRFFEKFFQKFFPKFFQYFFENFLSKFFRKLRHTASTMVSLVPGLGSRKFATQVVYLSLASLGLVAANSRLHGSFTFYVHNPNLVRFFQNFFQKFFPKFFQYFFQKFLPKFFPKLRHTASTMVSLVPGLGSRKFATQVVYLSLASLGLVAANSRLHASFTFYVRNPNLVRFFQNLLQYFFEKILPKFFPKLRHTASTMVSLVPGLGSRKFATQVVYLSLASLGLVAANSRLHASFTFYVHNPNLVRFFQNFFQKIFPKFFQYFFQKFLPKFFPKLRHTASTMVSLVPGLGSRKFATQVVYLSLAYLGLVAANSRLHDSFTFYVRNPNLVRFFENFFQNFFPKFSQYFFQKFLPKFLKKLRHTASTMVSLVPGLGSRKFATQVVYLSLAYLGLVAANSRLHASLTFYVRNPNLVRYLQKNFQKFFPKFFQYVFQKLLPKFFPKLRHTASTMVSLVPGLGSRKFATQVVYLSLASLGLVAANSRLHASFTFYVRNPNLVRFFQNFLQYFFQKFLPKFFPKLRHTASTMVSLVPGLGSRKFATQVVYLSLASLGLVAANSRLHASLTFYVRNPNLVRFFENFFQKFFPKFFQYFFEKCLPKFFPKLRHTASTMVSLVPGLGSRKFATQVVYLSLASLGLVAANSRLHASFTFYVRNPNLVRFFQNFSNIFFKNFCQNFCQNCDTRLLQWYLWSLGLVAANSRLRLCTCPLRLWAW